MMAANLAARSKALRADPPDVRLVHQDITGSQRQFIAYINFPDTQTLRQYFEGHLPESTEVVKT